jgi:hypothetical protein
MTVTLRISWRALFEQIPLKGICSSFFLPKPINLAIDSKENLFSSLVVDWSIAIFQNILLSDRDELNLFNSSLSLLSGDLRLVASALRKLFLTRVYRLLHRS